MTRVAVVAHRKKTLGGGLDELRRRLTDEGVTGLLWYEVPKSRKAPKKARKAVRNGAELVLIWGGDGMVQHCVDALAGWDGVAAIIPAGTANLLATNLDIPQDLEQAVRIALHGQHRRLDLGRVNGQHFAVMAGAGFDAEMIADADRKLKDSAGKFAYVWTGLRHVRDEVMPMRIRVDGQEWFDGEASCVLLGNVSTITGGDRGHDVRTRRWGVRHDQAVESPGGAGRDHGVRAGPAGTLITTREPALVGLVHRGASGAGRCCFSRLPGWR